MHKHAMLAVLTALTKISSANDHNLEMGSLPLPNDAQQLARNPQAVVPLWPYTGITSERAVDTDRCGPAFNGLKCPSNTCCSHAGYCGTTEEFCSIPNNCQAEFGFCDSSKTPTGASVWDDKPMFDGAIGARIDRCTEPHILALSFDDGPSNYTNQVLDVLKAHGARATFFLGGVFNGRGQLDDDKNAPVVRRIVTEGHQIGSHTWSHPDLDKLQSLQRKDDMHKNERAISNVIGKIPTFMRPPFLSCNQNCEQDMKGLGYHIVTWQYDSRDWVNPLNSTREMTNDNMTAAINSLIPAMDNIAFDGNMLVIQHDIHPNAATLADTLLKHMHETKSGWQAVPLVECIGHNLDDAYRFPMYLEYNGAAKGGCLVSDTNMCIQLTVFKTKDGCESAKYNLINDWNACKASGGNRASCLQAEKLAADMGRFCHFCGLENEPACDSDAFKTVNM